MTRITPERLFVLNISFCRTGIRMVTVTLAYDGSNQVAWRSSRGSPGSIQLNCGTE